MNLNLTWRSASNDPSLTLKPRCGRTEQSARNEQGRVVQDESETSPRSVAGSPGAAKKRRKGSQPEGSRCQTMDDLVKGARGTGVPQFVQDGLVRRLRSAPLPDSICITGRNIHDALVAYGSQPFPHDARCVIEWVHLVPRWALGRQQST